MKFGQFAQKDCLWMLKHSRVEMKYYSQYRCHDLFELQESLSGLTNPTVGSSWPTTFPGTG